MNTFTPSSPILVLGASGLLGSYMVQQLPGAILLTPSHAELDITQSDQVRTFMDKHTPSLIINCAAYTDVRTAEQNPPLAEAINAGAVQTLAQAAHEHNIRLIQVSTDYVFDGYKPSPYTEEDEPNPHTVYGKSKWAGEQAIANQLDPALSVIIRTSWLGTPTQGLIATLFGQLKTQDELCLTNSIISSPTRADSLARIIARMVATPSLHGMFHVSSNGEVTPYQLAHELQKQALTLRLIDRPKKLCTGYIDSVPRPAYSYLDGQKIEQALSIPLEPWQQVVSHFLASQPHL